MLAAHSFCRIPPRHQRLLSGSPIKAEGLAGLLGPSLVYTWLMAGADPNQCGEKLKKEKTLETYTERLFALTFPVFQQLPSVCSP